MALSPNHYLVLNGVEAAASTAAPGDLISTASGNVTVERVTFSVEKGLHGIGVPSGTFYADKVATSYFVDLGVSRRAWDRVLGYATLRHRIGAPMDKFLAYCHRDGLCLFDVDWFGTLCETWTSPTSSVALRDLTIYMMAASETVHALLEAALAGSLAFWALPLLGGGLAFPALLRRRRKEKLA